MIAKTVSIVVNLTGFLAATFFTGFPTSILSTAIISLSTFFESASISLFTQMRVLATNQSGYISGETLKSLDRPDTFLVISAWKSSDYWEKWLLSKERQETQDKIDALLGRKTE